MRLVLSFLVFYCSLASAQEAPVAQPAFPEHVRVPDERVKTLSMFAKKLSYTSQAGQAPISCPSVCAAAFVFIKQGPSCNCYDWDLAAPTAIEELKPGHSEFWVSSTVDKRLPPPNYEFRPPPREGNSVKYSVTNIDYQNQKTNADCAAYCDSKPECVGYWWTEELGGVCKYYSKIRADEALGESFADRMLYFKSSALVQIVPPQGYGFLPETFTIPRPLADRLHDKPVSEQDTSTPQVAKYLFNQLEGAKLGIKDMDACKAECDAAKLCLGFLWNPTSKTCTPYQSIILNQETGHQIPAGETIYIKTLAVLNICGLPDFFYQNGKCVDSSQVVQPPEQTDVPGNNEKPGITDRTIPEDSFSASYELLPTAFNQEPINYIVTAAKVEASENEEKCFQVCERDADACVGYAYDASKPQTSCRIFSSLKVSQTGNGAENLVGTVRIKKTAFASICMSPGYVFTNGQCVDPTAGQNPGLGGGGATPGSDGLRAKRFKLKDHHNLHLIGHHHTILDLTAGAQGSSCTLRKDTAIPKCNTKTHFEIKLTCTNKDTKDFLIVATPCQPDNINEPSHTAFFNILGHMVQDPETIIACNHRKGVPNPLIGKKEYVARNIDKASLYFHSEMLHHKDPTGGLWNKFKLTDAQTILKQFKDEEFLKKTATNPTPQPPSGPLQKRNIFTKAAELISDVATSIKQVVEIPVDKSKEFETSFSDSIPVTLFKYGHDGTCAPGLHELSAGIEANETIEYDLRAIVGIHAIGTLIPLELTSFLVYAQIGGKLVLKTEIAAHLEYRVTKDIPIIEIPLSSFSVPGIIDIGPMFDLVASPYAEFKASGTFTDVVTINLPQYKVSYNPFVDANVQFEKTEGSVTNEPSFDVTMEGRMGVKVTPALKFEAKLMESEAFEVSLAMTMPALVQFYMNNNMCMSLDGWVTAGYEVNIFGNKFADNIKPVPFNIWNNEQCAGVSIDSTQIAGDPKLADESGSCPQLNGYIYVFNEENVAKAEKFLSRQGTGGEAVAPAPAPNPNDVVPPIRRRSLLSKRQEDQFVTNYETPGSQAVFVNPQALGSCGQIDSLASHNMRLVGKLPDNMRWNDIARTFFVAESVDVNIANQGQPQGRGAKVYKRESRPWRCWVTDGNTQPNEELYHCIHRRPHNLHVTRNGMADLAVPNPSTASTVVEDVRTFANPTVCFRQDTRQVIDIGTTARDQYDAYKRANPFRCHGSTIDLLLTERIMKSDALKIRKDTDRRVGDANVQFQDTEVGNTMEWYGLTDIYKYCMYKIDAVANAPYSVMKLGHTRAVRTGGQHANGVRAFFTYDAEKNVISHFCGFYHHATVVLRGRTNTAGYSRCPITPEIPTIDEWRPPNLQPQPQP